jgi:hypothetical protein
MRHNLLLLKLISNLTLSLLCNNPVVQLRGSVLLIRKPLGHTITQTGGYQLLTTTARVQSQGRSCGLILDGVALGQVFSSYFSFPC